MSEQEDNNTTGSLEIQGIHPPLGDCFTMPNTTQHLCHWCATALVQERRKFGKGALLGFLCPNAQQHPESADRCHLCGWRRFLKDLESPSTGKTAVVSYCSNLSCASLG